MVKALLTRAAFVFFVAFTSRGFGLETKPCVLKPFVLDAVPFSSDYLLRSWDVFDGLPSNNVSAIDQTPDGYLWLAAGNGITRFDGLRFTSLPKKDNPGLESDYVGALVVARDGALWVGLGQGGVARFCAGHFQPIVSLRPTADQAQWQWTSSLAEDAEGGMWFGYGQGLKAFRWRDGKLSSFSSTDGIGPGHETFVYADVNGAIWFATRKACGVFDGHRFKIIDRSGVGWPRLAPSRDGGMWATAGPLLMHYHADGKREIIADIGGLAVSILYEDRSGNLWIGTINHGLLRFHEGSFVRVTTSHSHIYSITEDREGNLWVGTYGGGLNRLRPRSFSLHQLKDGLLNDNITTLCEDSEGKLWLAGIDGFPVRALDSTNQTFALPQNWVNERVLNLYADPAGGVWFGSFGSAGLMHWQNGIFKHVALRESITGLLQDREGDLWVATLDNQLVRWNNGNAIYISQDGGLFKPRALAEDTSGRIWVGTEGGLIFQRQNDRFVPVPLPGAGPNGQIRFIVPDINDTVWIGALSGGLYRWRAGQLRHLSNDAGLPTEDLRVLTIDPDGNFWFGTANGLVSAPRSEIDAAVDGTLSFIHATLYGRNDGLPSVEFAYGFRNAATRTQDGHLWFATYRGALEVDPKKLTGESPPASVLVEEIQLGDKTLNSSGNSELSLPPNPGPLRIHYTLPEMSSPEQIHFRYRLVGLGNEEWVEAGDQRMAAFADLLPGKYRFEAEAAQAEGSWIPGSGTLAFSVQAAWWQTILFRVIVLIFAALAVGGLARAIELRRVRARMRHLEQEHALERERTRIARDIHDEVGSNLTHISIASHLAQLEPPDAASLHIEEVTAITRNTIKLLGEIVWAINPRCDTLDSLINYVNQYAVNLLSAAGITCEADIPEKVPAHPLTAEVRHHLFLVVKEALNNVVKYAGAKVVGLKVEIVDNKLRIVIADDGCGFEMGSQRTGGNGLRNMRERMNEIGGECRIESFRGNGTRVTLEFALRAASTWLPGQHL
jgi:signal transduction histidine kinase/ligand-binding sensor domain-containing protein